MDLLEEARGQLRAHGLRVTTPRLEVLLCLYGRNQAMTHSEVVETLDGAEFDAATVYRNLVKMSEAGILQVVSRAGGMARYAVPKSEQSNHEDHVHFFCTDCGAVSCLPDELKPQLNIKGRWRAAVQSARLQLEGVCPSCLED